MYPKRGEISHRLSCNRVSAAKCMIMANGFWREQFCEACRSNTTLVLAFRLKISDNVDSIRLLKGRFCS